VRCLLVRIDAAHDLCYGGVHLRPYPVRRVFQLGHGTGRNPAPGRDGFLDSFKRAQDRRSHGRQGTFDGRLRPTASHTGSCSRSQFRRSSGSASHCFSAGPCAPRRGTATRARAFAGHRAGRAAVSGAACLGLGLCREVRDARSLLRERARVRKGGREKGSGASRYCGRGKVSTRAKRIERPNELSEHMSENVLVPKTRGSVVG